MAAQVPSKSSKTESDTANTKETSADEIPPETYSDLISTLPVRAGWVMPLVLYHNYWLNPARLKHIIPVKEHYKPRSDDIILATSPKCGTTWLKALSFAITTRSRRHTFAAAAADDDHPLLTQLHPQELVAHLETPNPAAGGLAAIEKLPSPRLLATHLPLSLLPPAISTCGCRVVYLCRQPKDVCISLCHFGNGILRGVRTKSSPVQLQLEESVSTFCEGISPFGPFWEHYLEYWKESLARPQQVLFLKYEDIVSEPLKIVETLADFFAVPFSEEEKRIGVPEDVVRLCSFEVLSGMESNRSGDVTRGDDIVIGKSLFFRKGKVGDWEIELGLGPSRYGPPVLWAMSSPTS